MYVKEKNKSIRSVRWNVKKNKIKAFVRKCTGLNIWEISFKNVLGCY